MLIKMILGFITGYVRIEVSGFYIERFINLCNGNKIFIWNLKKESNSSLLVNVEVCDLKKASELAKKVNCILKIKKKKGLIFIFKRYKKRKIFFLFLLIVVFLVGMSSNFIWNIDVQEENSEKLDGIYEDLENAGMKTGEFKSSIDTRDIINKVRLKRNDIAWMGIDLKGTNAIVKIVKATEKPEIIDESEYSNIISNKEGVITKISAQNGTAQVRAGDIVKNGTILIGGWMEGKFTGVRYVHATGEIEAKVWYTKNINMKYNTTETRKTGEFENKYKIKFNNFQINFYKKLSKFEIYDTIETEEKIKLLSDFYLPISIVKITNEEEENVQETYSFEEARDLGVKKLEEELDTQIQNKESITNKNVNVYENSDSVDVFVTYEVLEKIGTNEKIVF